MRRLDFSSWSTRDITTFIGDELDGSSWSISKYPGVSFKDVMAEALTRWGKDLHIVTSADKNVLDACAKLGPIKSWANDVWDAERERRESLRNSPKD
jgi:hypothetical protein